MEILFDGIPLDKVSTSMTINSTAAILLAMYIAVAEKQGVKAEVLQGTIQNDILKEYAARGTYIFPPFESMRIITDIFAFCKDHVPRWNTISISGYHMREAGLRPSRKSPLRLPTALLMWRQRSEAGLDVDSFASRLSFFFYSHNTFHRRDCQIQGCPQALGQDHEGPLQGQKGRILHAPVSHADRRLLP